MWVGHSRPTLLLLPYFCPLAEVKINTKINTKTKCVGQECPTHTIYFTTRSTIRIKPTQIAKLHTALPARERIATQFVWVSSVSLCHMGEAPNTSVVTPVLAC